MQLCGPPVLDQIRAGEGAMFPSGNRTPDKIGSSVRRLAGVRWNCTTKESERERERGMTLSALKMRESKQRRLQHYYTFDSRDVTA